MITEGKKKIAAASKVIYIVKHIMNRCKCNEEKACQLFFATETYSLLVSYQYSLFLSPPDYVVDALGVELNSGREALYDYLETNLAND